MDVNQQPKSAMYSNDCIKKLTGQEKFVDGTVPTTVSITDYWQWAYSDLIRNTQRGVLAEFIVKTALDNGGVCVNHPMRLAFEPYDLLGPRILDESRCARLEIKSAAYIQSWEQRHPGKKQSLSFSIAPASVPDENGDYKDGAPKQRNSDLYIFCIFTPPAEDRDASILNLSLWRFYVAKTTKINDICGSRKSISTKSESFQSITEGGELTFSELCPAIIQACESFGK